MPDKSWPLSFPITALVGSSFPNIIKISFQHKIDRKYRARFMLTIFITFLFEPFRWWENITRNGKIKKLEIKYPPVFIIGFWRSGTTLLHNLLCLMPDAAYVSTFHTVFPHIVLSQSWWLKKVAKMLMPGKRPWDGMKMNLDYPQEEEIALANIEPSSFYDFWYFPKDLKKIYENGLSLKGQDKNIEAKWKRDYDRLIRKSMINTHGKQFISKNPSNITRISLLQELYPGAKFIFLYRNPYRVMESFYRFSRVVLPAVQLQEAEEEQIRQLFMKVFSETHRNFLSEKEMIPAENLVEVKYEDFEADKLGTIRHIFDKLKLPGYQAALPAIEKHLSIADHNGRTRYEISPLTVKLVNESIPDLLKFWGYDIMK